MSYWPFSSKENEEFYEKVAKSKHDTDNPTFSKRRKKVENKMMKDNERIKQLEDIKVDAAKRKDEKRAKRREKYKE